MLGTSRGGGDVKKIVDAMQQMGINALFVLGGNGTHAGAQAIWQECEKRGYEVAVVGVPKTIDNDILHVRDCCVSSPSQSLLRWDVPALLGCGALLSRPLWQRVLRMVVSRCCVFVVQIDKTFGFDTAVEAAQR